jgi:hypothetical protein
LLAVGTQARGPRESYGINYKDRIRIPKDDAKACDRQTIEVTQKRMTGRS